MEKRKMPKKEPRIEKQKSESKPAGKKPEKIQKKQSETAQILIVAAVLILLVIGTIFIYNRFFAPEEPKARTFTFNGFTFTQKGELWETQVQIENKLITLPLHYTPHEVRSAYIGGRLNESFNHGSLYITFDPEEENLTNVALAVAELSLNIAQGVGRELIAACAKNTTEACYTRPLVDCDSDVSVIYVKHGPTPFVKLEDNCIVITGEGQDLIRAVDKLLYFWYGIIDNREGLQNQ